MNSMQALRIARGLTQAQVADRIGVGQSAVAEWERGAKRPTLDHAKALAKVYGVAVEDLDEESA